MRIQSARDRHWIDKVVFSVSFKKPQPQLRFGPLDPIRGFGIRDAELRNAWQVAGLGFAVQLKNRDFIGATALKAIKGRPDQPQRIGLELSGKRVPREHYPVLANGVAVGEITSGTFSPTLERPIAMAYVQPHAAESGTELTVDIRGRAEAARIVPLPFYKRESD